METEELIQAAKEIRDICDNADGCDECPFCRQDGLYNVICKFFDKTGGYCSPCEWYLNGEESECQKWKPNLHEKYFMCVSGNVCKESWHNSVIDLMNYATGNCFKTKEEAEKRDKAVIARLKKIYADGTPLIGADEWRDKE